MKIRDSKKYIYKKVGTFLIFAVLAVPSFSLADLPDISTLSKDELIELNIQIQHRLFSENLENGVRVPQGTYTIGIDIPAGSYRIEITDGTGYYELYEKEDGPILNTGITGSGYKVKDIGRIVFDDGNILKIVNSTFVFFPYTGLFY